MVITDHYRHEYESTSTDSSGSRHQCHIIMSAGQAQAFKSFVLRRSLFSKTLQKLRRFLGEDLGEDGCEK